MTEGQTITRKEFPNGDVAVDEGNGLVYHTPDARYTVKVVPPPPLSEDPYGVDLVRTTRSEHGLPRRQRLTLAEYHSYMSAEEHVREVEGTLLERGREGLQTEMALVEAMPFEPDTATYLTGIYPPEWSAGRPTLSVIRLEGERVDVAPVAYGPVDRLAAVDRRLEQALAEGGPDRLLDVATAEAVQAGILPPGTPLFAPAGEDWGVNRLPAAQDRPAGPALAVPGLPVTFEDDMTPLDAQGRYVAHHRDAAGTVHFFAVMDRPPEDLTPGDAPRELRYFRAQKTAEGQVIHDSLPVMPVSAPGSPWPIPIFSSLLEDDRLEEVQSLARDLAHLNDLPFPDTLPPLGAADPEIVPAYGTLPTATPRFAGEKLVAGSEQPAMPYRTPEDVAPEVIALPTDLAPTWRLDIVPARDPEGAALGYSAVCVVDFSDLAETLAPEAPERGQWLEVAHFATEERADQFREDFMSVAGMEEMSHLSGPGFAEAVAGDLGMSGGWQVMDKESLEKLKAGDWAVEHPEATWQPRLNEASSPALEAAYHDIDL
jgi:hypothetical protein